MKIGVILFSHSIGGTEKRICNLHRYLKQNTEHEYRLFINRFLADLLWDISFLDGLEEIIHVLPENDTTFMRFIDSPTDLFRNRAFRFPGPNLAIHKLKSLFKQSALTIRDPALIDDLDLIHCCGPYPWEPIPRDIPVIQEVQDLYMNILKTRGSRRRILRKSTYLNCASERIRDELIKKLPQAEISRFVVSPCSFIDYSKTRIDKKEKWITFAGRLISEKGPRLFIESIELIMKERGDIHFQIMGTGRDESELKRFIESRGLSDHVEIGFRKDPISVLARSLVFVSLQKVDNYHSQALMEAMACGCAIIASDVGHTARLIDDEVGARIPIDAGVLADRIIEMVDDMPGSEAKGKQARERVMGSHNVESYASYMIDLYQSATGQTGAKSTAGQFIP